MDKKPRAVRPEHVEPDPRTDGVGDGGERELPPPSDEEIAAGVEQDHARAALAAYEDSGRASVPFEQARAEADEADE